MPNETQFTCLPVPMEQEDEFKMAQFLLNQIKKPYDYAGALGYFFRFVPHRQNILNITVVN